VLLAPLASFVGLLYQHEFETAYWKYVHKSVAPGPDLSTEYGQGLGFNLLVLLGQLRYLLSEGPLALEVQATGFSQMVAAGGYDEPGLLLSFNANFGQELIRGSHAAVKAVTYDPHGKRPHDLFIGAINTTEKANYFLPGAVPTLLQRDTDDPMHFKVKNLYAGAIPALFRKPPIATEFKLAPGLTKKSFLDAVMKWDGAWGLVFSGGKFCPDEVMDATGFMLFKHVFDLELLREEMEMLREWTGILGALALGPGDETTAMRSVEIASHFEGRLLESQFGKRFQQTAKSQGMNGTVHLREWFLEFAFAGYGAPGGSLFALRVMLQMRKDLKHWVPVYKQNPDAFIKESARLYGGGGGGISAFVVPETKTYTLGSGHVITEHAGQLAPATTNLANRDPLVFGRHKEDFEYAAQFVPLRKNADKMISFLAELGDIRKCRNVTGCPEAPRFCPGVEVVQRVTRQIVDFFVDCLESTRHNSDEL